MNPLQALKSRIIHRDQQFDLLNAFVSNDVETCAPMVIVHGYKSCGKSITVMEYVKSLGVKYSLVQAQTVLTTKILLQTCIKAIRKDSGVTQKFDFYDKGTIAKVTQVGETTFNFQYNLYQFLKHSGYKDQHILIIDNIDQLIEDSIQVIDSFAKMREWIDIANIFVIIISRAECVHEIITSSIPQIHFQPYSEQQIIDIFQANQFCHFGEPTLDKSATGKQFWDSFTQIMVTLFYEYTGPHISLLIDLCCTKWPQFIDTIVNGDYSPNEFLTVYRENKDIFMGDDVMVNTIVKDYETLEVEPYVSSLDLSTLTNVSKFILIASYLASYIEPKKDIHYFAPIKYSKFTGVKRFQKKDELTKKDMDNKLFQANFFDLERLYAILLVIYRNESKSFETDADILAVPTELDIAAIQREISTFSLAGNNDLHNQMAVLLSRGFLFRQMTRDTLQPKTRWKCSLDWDTISIIANDVSFPLQDYF